MGAAVDVDDAVERVVVALAHLTDAVEDDPQVWVANTRKFIAASLTAERGPGGVRLVQPPAVPGEGPVTMSDGAYLRADVFASETVRLALVLEVLAGR